MPGTGAGKSNLVAIVTKELFACKDSFPAESEGNTCIETSCRPVAAPTIHCVGWVPARYQSTIKKSNEVEDKGSLKISGGQK